MRVAVAAVLILAACAAPAQRQADRIEAKVVPPAQRAPWERTGSYYGGCKEQEPADRAELVCSCFQRLLWIYITPAEFDAPAPKGLQDPIVQKMAMLRYKCMIDANAVLGTTFR